VLKEEEEIVAYFNTVLRLVGGHFGELRRKRFLLLLALRFPDGPILNNNFLSPKLDHNLLPLAPAEFAHYFNR